MHGCVVECKNILEYKKMVQSVIYGRSIKGMSLIETMLVLVVAMGLSIVGIVGHRNYMQKVYVQEAVSLALGINKGIKGISYSLERYGALISKEGITEESARKIFDSKLFDADGFLSYQYGQVDIRSVSIDRVYDSVGISFKDAPSHFCIALIGQLYTEYDQIRVGDGPESLKLIWTKADAFDIGQITQKCMTEKEKVDAQWVQFIKKSY